MTDETRYWPGAGKHHIVRRVDVMGDVGWRTLCGLPPMAGVIPDDNIPDRQPPDEIRWRPESICARCRRSRRLR